MLDPSLSPLVGIAAFVLALNLAYLRFETFEHRDRIRKRAVAKLGDVGDIREGWRDSDYYKRLSYWADIADGVTAPKELGWRAVYPWVFEGNRDRTTARVMVWCMVPIVFTGLMVFGAQIQIPTWFGRVVPVVLQVALVVSVTLVLGGNDYISKAFEMIDKDSEQWKIFVRDTTPQATAAGSNRESSLGGLAARRLVRGVPSTSAGRRSHPGFTGLRRPKRPPDQ